jgi:shikimate kinase
VHELFTATRPHVVVLGLMGIGKSTTAQAIAASRGVTAHDSDVDIETLFGATGGQLVINHGLDELHRIESAVLLGRLASDVPSVISAAAGIVEDPRCCEALANRAYVIVLQAPVGEIIRRMATGAHRRVMDTAELTALAHRRAPLFAAVADLELDATRPTEELVAAVLT